MGSTIGDGTTPVYRFEWDDRESRTTDGLPGIDGLTDAVETLTELGRRDPDCEVTLLRFE